MSEVLLEAIAPAGIEAAWQAMNEFEHQQDEQRRAWELSLEKARYEVDRARRQYDEVDPANRLVAAELEARWNAALERAAAWDRELQQLSSQRVALTDEQQVRLLELGRDLPTLWQHDSATTAVKKRILRTVLEEIVISDDESRTNHRLALHWKGGVHTELSVLRNAPGKKYCETSKTALELIEELSKVCSDQTIAATLNRLGFKTGADKTWRLHSVHNARHLHRLTNHRPAQAWVTVQQAAAELGVSPTVVRRLIGDGTLPAKQVVATTPWIIDRESLTLPTVQTEIDAVKTGRQPPREDSTQALFPFK